MSVLVSLSSDDGDKGGSKNRERHSLRFSRPRVGQTMSSSSSVWAKFQTEIAEWARVRSSFRRWGSCDGVTRGERTERMASTTLSARWGGGVGGGEVPLDVDVGGDGEAGDRD